VGVPEIRPVVVLKLRPLPIAGVMEKLAIVPPVEEIA
jgi:hypothetical protein